MTTPEILNVGVYRHAQKGTQEVPVLFLGLYMKGLVKSTVYYPDGTLCRKVDGIVDNPPPRLSISTPGFSSDFEYGPTRENWVAMLNFPEIHFDDEQHQLYWNYNGHDIPIPRVMDLNEARAMEIRHAFDTLCRLYSSSLPQNQLAAELLVMQLLREFLQMSVPADDIVERFRLKIEKDLLWEKSITDHCRELNVNRDKLRIAFHDRYKISPGEYRINMRFRRICHLLAYSSLSLKEITYEVGMKNLSHLTGFVKKTCGKTPSELSREYRRK